MSHVSVLGLGAMGSRMARRLVEAGHEVTVWNRTAERATELAGEVDVNVAESPRTAVAGADLVISMVANDAASRSLWLDPGDGALGLLSDDAIAIEASTVTRSMAVEIGEAAANHGVGFLEAPVVGSRPQADAGGLFVLVGGEASVLAAARPVIDAYAGGIRHLGPIGNAATMKLAINTLFGIQVAAYAEIVGLLGKSEVDDVQAIEILASLPITSPGLQRILGLFSERDFEPNFPVALVAKDLSYLSELAQHLGASVPVAEAASAIFDAGAGGPQRDLDISGIADRYLPR